MNELRNPRLQPYARTLRREMTREERHLWYDFLKGLPCPVKRQKVIGPYIVDFYIPSRMLVIELDGRQHDEACEQRYDRERDRFLGQAGMEVMRFSNHDINSNFNFVCRAIEERLQN